MTRWRSLIALWLFLLGCGAVPVAVAAASSPQNIATIFVAPGGSDTADGTALHPFQTLERAQRAVREVNCDRDVEVRLAEGIYRLERPLVFTVKDGGCHGHRVEWRAAEGARPVISGAIRITGWKMYDAERNIYVADVSAGSGSRQLWVNDELARRTEE